MKNWTLLSIMAGICLLPRTLFECRTRQIDLLRGREPTFALLHAQGRASSAGLRMESPSSLALNSPRPVRELLLDPGNTSRFIVTKALTSAILVMATAFPPAPLVSDSGAETKPPAGDIVITGSSSTIEILIRNLARRISVKNVIDATEELKLASSRCRDSPLGRKI